jgi:MFS family permease
MRKLLAGLEVAPDNHGLLTAVNYAFFVSGIAAIMLGVLLPYIRAEYSLNYTQSGLMFSSHQLGNFCAVLAAGVLPYMIGRKKSTLLMGAGTALGLILIVAARDPWLLMLAFALTGVGRGTMSNICNVVIADISGNRAVALNVLHSVFATGALISPVIVFLSRWLLSPGQSFPIPPRKRIKTAPALF